MSETEGLFMPHGGCENLRSYNVAEVVYDAKAAIAWVQHFSHHLASQQGMAGFVLANPWP